MSFNGGLHAGPGFSYPGVEYIFRFLGKISSTNDRQERNYISCKSTLGL
jgi:hypothetical protein